VESGLSQKKSNSIRRDDLAVAHLYLLSPIRRNASSPGAWRPAEMGTHGEMSFTRSTRQRAESHLRSFSHLCSNDATIKILGFRQSDHGLFSTPATAQVYFKVQDAKIVWTKGFVVYGGL
jgi:hypothetical protein